MQKILPCLWYNFNAEEAVDFYMTVFKDGKIIARNYYNAQNPFGPEGSVLTIDFEILGQRFLALNAGPQYPHTDAVSFIIDTPTQKEVDYYWNAFLDGGGTAEQCGWIRDRFGLAWQVSPHFLGDMLRDPNRKKADAVMKAMMEMVKIDIAAINAAYNNS